LNKTNTPQVALSTQAIINCEQGGDCNGGFHGVVYRYAQNTGIPHASCEQYIAHNVDSSEVCSAFNVCRECTGPAPAWNETGFDHCRGVETYDHYRITKTRSLNGVRSMKEELAAYGPISCGMDATEKFENYKGGIFEEKRKRSTNHIISLVGYGTDEETGTHYWIGRNSWGTYWGEEGFFRIKLGVNSNAIEEDCASGYPGDESAFNEETE